MGEGHQICKAHAANAWHCLQPEWAQCCRESSHYSQVFRIGISVDIAGAYNSVGVYINMCTIFIEADGLQWIRGELETVCRQVEIINDFRRQMTNGMRNR